MICKGNRELYIFFLGSATQRDTWKKFEMDVKCDFIILLPSIGSLGN